MATQGPRAGGTFAGNVGGGGTVNWTNPGNAAVSDDIYATVVTNSDETSNLLAITNFGFTIPAGATIDGIELRVEGKVTGGSGITPFSVTKNGTVAAVVYADQLWTGTDTTFTRGGPTNLLGTTWTPAEINATTFGIVIYSYTEAGQPARTASIDFGSITVYYTGGGGGGGGSVTATRSFRPGARDGAGGVPR